MKPWNYDFFFVYIYIDIFFKRFEFLRLEICRGPYTCTIKTICENIIKRKNYCVSAVNINLFILGYWQLRICLIILDGQIVGANSNEM